ncbi:3D domain-containing protein [Niallia sp. 03133]|uniref:3D domain-containing protein n=1 Tax=Niallia sp. 03133 TaxID=3458060 RepID=UPI004043FB8E
MRSLKNIMVITLASMLSFSPAIMAHAETNQETLNNSHNRLKQNEELLNDKEAEKQKVVKELDAVHNDLSKFNTELAENKANVAAVELDITDSQTKIEEKKEEIVTLEDKVLSRKKVMKDRLVSLQHNDQTNVIIDVLLNAKSLSDLLDRATAVTVIYNMDKDILEQQESDLKQIEKEKQEIAQEEKMLQKQYETLASNQADLEENLQKRQEVLSEVQKKYKTISNDIAIAENEKSTIQKEMKQQQDSLKKQQQEAKNRSKEIVQQKKTVKVNTIKVAAVSTEKKQTENSSANDNKEEIYVTATAYSHESVSSERTALGYNIKKNPNMKLIAVDPSVIPLGSKVWVEGYGEAVAGDTGGAIKGHKIDVLVPNNGKARAWGRKTVRVVILD